MRNAIAALPQCCSAALFIVATACTADPFGGVGLCLDGVQMHRVEWGEQGDQRTIGPYLDSCAATIGWEISPGARIVFAAATEWPCAHSAGGCYMSESGNVYVRPIDRLWRSELCHELLHREMHIETGDADGGHTAPEWGRFCGGGYLICEDPPGLP